MQRVRGKRPMADEIDAAMSTVKAAGLYPVRDRPFGDPHQAQLAIGEQPVLARCQGRNARAVSDDKLPLTRVSHDGLYLWTLSDR